VATVPLMVCQVKTEVSYFGWSTQPFDGLESSSSLSLSFFSFFSTRFVATSSLIYNTCIAVSHAAQSLYYLMAKDGTRSSVDMLGCWSMYVGMCMWFSESKTIRDYVGPVIRGVLVTGGDYTEVHLLSSIIL
jgi:hypothetical protein